MYLFKQDHQRNCHFIIVKQMPCDFKEKKERIWAQEALGVNLAFVKTKEGPEERIKLLFKKLFFIFKTIIKFIFCICCCLVTPAMSNP